MSIVIFSDTHFSTAFDQNRFEVLTQVIRQHDRVIINGDFFDAYLCSFDSFVTSSWRKLFPLLKKKQAVYIYGNHDKPEYLDDRVSAFSDEQRYKKEFVVNGQKFMVQHGHTYAPHFDDQYPQLTKLVKRWYPQYVYHLENPTWFHRYVMRWYCAIEYAIKDRKLKNSIITVKNKNQELQNTIMICGHTHLLQYDPKLGYANSGWFRNGRAQYLVIEDSGQLKMVDDTY